MAHLLSSGINGFICSAKKVAGVLKEWFISGFAGYGWKIWERNPGKYCLEIDDLVVRNKMTVYELIISKIRSVMGALAITQAHGKIKEIDPYTEPDNYLITLEDNNSFLANDYIRMQEFSGSYRSYWVQVSAIKKKGDIDVIVISKSEFMEDEAPQVGDELIQFGNSSVKDRQSAIYLHADEAGQPALDLMFGIDSKSFDGKTKLRLGAALPGEPDQYKGLYAENGMLKFTDDAGNVTSTIYPDGTAEFAAGSVLFNPDKSGHIAGGAISWQWDGDKYVCKFESNVILQWNNLSEETRQNLKGIPGDDGKTNYFHIKYSSVPNPQTSAQISDQPAAYIGTYVDSNPTSSNDPSKYTWARIEGIPGENGIPGKNGEDGKTYYLHIKYSNDGGTTFTGNNGEDPGSWLGQYTDTEEKDSMDIGLYTWAKIKGEDGEDAVLPDWLDAWNGKTTLIGDQYVISPKIFAGKGENNPQERILTGIAIGNEVVGNKSGIFAYNKNDIVFSLDGDSGDAYFKGEINARSGHIGELDIADGEIVGKENDKTRIRISRNPIGSLNELNEGNPIRLVDPGQISAGFSIDVKPHQTNRQSVSCSTKAFYIASGGHISITLSNSSHTIYGTPPSYAVLHASFAGITVVNNSTNSAVASTSAFKDGTYTVSIPQEGTYRIEINWTLTVQVNNPDYTPFTVYGYVYNTVVAVGKFYQQCTLIGTDGLYSYWGPEDYFYAKKNISGQFDIEMCGNVIIKKRDGSIAFRNT